MNMRRLVWAIVLLVVSGTLATIVFNTAENHPGFQAGFTFACSGFLLMPVMMFLDFISDPKLREMRKNNALNRL